MLSNGSQIWIVVGMQFGSEGKGAITSYLANIMCMGIRTGAPNAGHTVYYKEKKYVMRQIPSTWINPISKLVIGCSSVINIEILMEEISMLEKVTEVKNRLFIDPKAHIITEDQISREQQTNLAIRIGSTSAISGEGIGIAQADKVMRSENCKLAKDVKELKPFLADTVDLINTKLDRGAFVLLEGTQGFGLDLNQGKFPFVTSRETTATAVAASVGIATHIYPVNVIGVTRTYPIRVAGNSGPFDSDSEEITWEDLTERACATEPIKEWTTVTKKVRRVATFSDLGFRRAVKVNRPTEIALTFADYLDWKSRNANELNSPRIQAFVEHIEDIAGIEVSLLKQGPENILDFDYYREHIIRKLAI